MSASDPADYRPRLIAARKRLGLEPSEMAERLMTPHQTYDQWESGASQTPGVAVVAAETITKARRHRPVTEAVLAALRPGRTNEDIAMITGATQDTVRSILRRNKRHAAPAPMGANSHK
jgi:DNA-binding XRE family transcriptional regulator